MRAVNAYLLQFGTASTIFVRSLSSNSSSFLFKHASISLSPSSNIGIISSYITSYISSVSTLSGLKLSAARQEAHPSEFRRLLREANELCDLMGQDEHLETGPIVVVKHSVPDNPQER